MRLITPLRQRLVDGTVSSPNGLHFDLLEVPRLTQPSVSPQPQSRLEVQTSHANSRGILQDLATKQWTQELQGTPPKRSADGLSRKTSANACMKPSFVKRSWPSSPVATSSGTAAIPKAPNPARRKRQGAHKHYTNIDSHDHHAATTAHLRSCCKGPMSCKEFN